MAWIVRLVKIAADGEEQCVDVMRISRPDDLNDIATLGLTLAEGKRLLAALQQEIVAAQARDHAIHRPDCRGCNGVCRVKDYRDQSFRILGAAVLRWRAVMIMALIGFRGGEASAEKWS